ncbi:MAG: non-ribosomal peptide synthetase, partial [bacterium]|nr:non-ribosomal peptide synthetase [bacterium]
RWRADGNIEFLGRVDHQVKIRGYRVELGEIENRLLERGEIAEAVVVVRKDKSEEKYLCAYIVTKSQEQTLEISELRETLTQTLPEYMIPSYYVNLEEIPLTANGKVNTKALPEPELLTTTEYAAPRDGVEEKLVAIWAEILKIEAQKAETTLGIDDNFFHMGGHSLKATLLAARMQKEFNVKIPLVQIFKTPRIRDIAGTIKRAEKEAYITIEPAAEKENYHLSSAQKRLYILQQMDKSSTGYNMNQMVLLEGALDWEKFETTIATLIDRHESLRTTFTMKAGEPV